MRMRNLILLGLGLILVVHASPARADLVLAAGGAWQGGERGTVPTASLGWQTSLRDLWGAGVRTSGPVTSVSLSRRLASERIAGVECTPRFAVGLDRADMGRGPLLHVSGYHVETALAMLLPEGARLELTARWVVRGDDDPRGPERFTSRYAEVTLGFVFLPD
jgi:hypothetical protein